MRRAQAALEFIVTYGWAILLILVMIGAIAYFGVLNPKDLTPERCVIGAEFSCDDFITRTVTDDGISNDDGNEIALSLTNTLGKSVHVYSNFKFECMDGCYANDRGDYEGYQACGQIKDGPDGGTNLAANGASWTVRNGEQFYIGCNTGSWSTIRPKDVGTPVRIRFEFNYTLQGGSIPHLVEGEIFTKPQE